MKKLYWLMAASMLAITPPLAAQQSSIPTAPKPTKPETQLQGDVLIITPEGVRVLDPMKNTDPDTPSDKEQFSDDVVIEEPQLPHQLNQIGNALFPSSMLGLDKPVSHETAKIGAVFYFVDDKGVCTYKTYFNPETLASSPHVDGQRAASAILKTRTKILQKSGLVDEALNHIQKPKLPCTPISMNFTTSALG